MRVLIVDDERRARERLSLLLAAISDVEIAEEAENGVMALEAVQNLRPDALFLGVQMRGLDGFDVVAALPRDAHPFIEVCAVDYLMKPVEEERLAQTMARLRDVAARDRIDDLLQRLKRTRLQRVVGKRLQKYHVLPIETVQALLADDELVFAVTMHDQFDIARPGSAARSRIFRPRAQADHRESVEDRGIGACFEGGATARLNGGETIEISRRYAPTLRDRLHW